MNRAELLDKLTKFAITVKECLDAEMTIVPTASIHELLKEAVLELEKKSPIKLESKQEIATKLKASDMVLTKQTMHIGSTQVGFAEMMRIAEEAEREAVRADVLPGSIHVQRGCRYAEKFLEAQTTGKLRGMQGPGTLYVGSDHAESFRHYLLDLVRDGARVVDRGPKNTMWMGMNVCRADGRASRVQWQENGVNWWVDAEDTPTIHTEYPSGMAGFASKIFT